jgi:ATP-binding cassette subfamily B protein
MSRPTNDANSVRIFLRMGLASIILDTSSILGSFIIIFLLNVKLALIAISILPFALVLAWLLGRFSRGAYRKSLSTLAGLTTKMQENLAGIKVIKSLVHEKRSYEEFSETQGKNIDANLHTVRISSSYQPVVMLMRIAGTALILYFGAMMVATGEITIGTIVAFIEYQFQYFMPLMDLVVVYDQYQSAMAAIERMFDLIDTKVEVEEPVTEATEIGTIVNVTFDNVTFGYAPSIPVVKNVSFSLDGSKKLAIVGPTGAGKSTMINLLARFYDPLEGRIVVNGCDVKDVRIESLRKQVGIVLQDSFLFP